MKLNRTRNKLMKNGFLPEVQESRWEKWIDVSEFGGTPISFWVKNDEVDGSLKIHGRRPDNPMVDEFNSCFTKSVKTAIELSRLK